MNRTASLFGLVVLAAVLAALAFGLRPPAPGTAGEADGKFDQAWWGRTEPFVHRVLNVPRSVKLELREVSPAAAAGFRRVVIEARRDEQVETLSFYTSADGQKVIIGELYDLSQDPFAANRKQIRLEQVPSQGLASAPVTIVEYSDYTCPWCLRFYLTLEKPLLEGYAGRVRYVYKHFPLVGSRAWSQEAAVAAACAFRQSNEAFWALHRQLFENPQRLSDKKFFSKLASGLPLDARKFERCLERRESLPDVERDIAEAKSLGVEGTPAFFINGRPVRGFLPRERFLEIVEEELAVANAPAKN